MGERNFDIITYHVDNGIAQMFVTGPPGQKVEQAVLEKKVFPL